MNNNTIVRLSIAALAAAALAACGGGGSGSSSPSPAVKAASTAPGSSSPASFANGTTKMTVTFTRGAAAHTKSKARLNTTARKRPTYISNNTNGFQVAITAGSALPVTFNIDFDTNNAATCLSAAFNTYTCTISVPTLGPTETINVLELDSEPTGTLDPATGIATGGSFPSGTAVLANGSTSATLTPGGITNLALSLNPVIGNWSDCGLGYATNNVMAEDYNNHRVVVTGNKASLGVLLPVPSDYDNNQPTAVVPPGGSPVGQPFVDVDGTAVALTGVSTLANVSMLALPAPTNSVPSPPAGGAYASSISIPDSSFAAPYGEGLYIAIRYDGFGTPSGTMKTLTFSNNLSVTPPFTGVPNYLATFVYGIAPVFATAASSTVTNSTSTLVVTGYDPGSPNSMNADHCYDGNGTDLGYASSTEPMTNGVQAFVFNAGSTTGTCAFTLWDSNTNVRSNPVLVTIQ